MVLLSNTLGLIHDQDDHLGIEIPGPSMIEPVKRRVQIGTVYKQMSHDRCETQIAIQPEAQHPLIWEPKSVTRWMTWGREGEGVHLDLNWCHMLQNTWYAGMVVGRNFNIDLWYKQQANEWICMKHNCECGGCRRCVNVIGSDAVHEEGSRKVWI